MRTRIDERLREEAVRFALRFACDDCVHFDAGPATCSFGYPCEPRRGALDGRSLSLCKSFEIA